MTSLINNGGTSLIGNAITYTASGLPTGMTLTLAGNLVGTPTSSGSGTITVIASDGYATATSNTTYTVTGSVATDGSWTNVTMLINGENASNWQANSLFTDLSSNGLVLNSVGSVAQGSFNPFGNDWGVYFGGGTPFLQAPQGDITLGTNDFTVEFWVLAQSWASTPYIIFYNGTGAGFAINVTPSGIISATGVGSITNAISANTWYHLAYVRKTGTVSLYVNGVLQSSGSYASSLGPCYLDFGACDGNAFSGYISNLRVLNGTALYTSNFTPPIAPLTAITNTVLLACQSNSFVDNSPNKFALTVSGTPAVQKFSPFVPTSSYASGLPTATSINWSNYFNGANQYLITTASTSMVFTNNFTVEAWLYITAVPQNGFIFENNFNVSTGGLASYVSTSRNIVTYITGSGVANTSFTTTNTVPLNQWTHFALVRNGNVATVYLNGIADPTTLAVTLASVNSGTTPTYVGSSAAFPGDVISGYISNFRMVNGSALYTTNFNVPTSTLTAIAGTTLLTCQSNSFTDNSANKLTVTNTGSVVAEQFGPFNGGMYSNYFSGGANYLTTTSTTLANLGSTAATTNGTIECWVYPTNTQNSGVGSIINAGSSNELWIICGTGAGTNNTGYISVWANFNISGYGVQNALQLNTWSHLAFTFTAGVPKLYINGVYLPSNISGYTGTSGIIINPNTATTIGSDYQNHYFNGYISNVRINTNILYPSNFTPPTSPLTAIAGTTLLTCQSDNFINNSPLNTGFTITGTPVVQQFNPFVNTTVATTPVTYSNYFNGSTNGYIQGPSSSATQFPGDFTIECWVYPTNYTASNGSYLFGTFNSGSNAGTGLSLQFYSTTGQLSFYNVSVNNQIVASTPCVLNAWQHVAVVRHSNVLTMYLNGVSVGSATNSTNFTDNNLFIGKSPFYANTNLTGYISNFRINNTTAVYTSNFTPSVVPLTAISGTSLLTCQSATIVDNSSNALALTNGSVGPTYNEPFNTTYSNYFNGSSYLTSPAANIPTSFYDVTSSSIMTIEYWVNPSSFASSVNGGSNCVSMANISNSGETLSFGPKSGGNVVFYYYNGSIQTLTTSSTIPLNAWTHLAVVKNGTSLTIYINGIQSATGTWSGTANQSIPLLIGAGSQAYFTGYISNLRITNTAVYTSNFTPSTNPLTAITGTQLLACQSNHFIDNSTNNIPLSTSGTPTVTQFIPSWLSSGATYSTPITTSYSNYFDGSTGYLTGLSGNAAYQFNANYTIECWIYPTSVSNTFTILDNRSSGGTNGVLLYVNGSSQLSFQAVGSGFTASSTLTANTWYHVAVVRNGSVNSLYLNGVVIGTISGSTAMTAGNLYIGAQNGGGSYFPGYISNLRINNTTAVYTSNFTPSTTALTAITGTSLLTCQSSNFVDNSVNNLPLTKNGNVAIRQDFQPFGTNWSNYFNGTSSYISATTSVCNFSGDFTVEAWINPISYNANAAMIFTTSITGGTDGAGYQVGIYSGGINYAAGPGNSWYFNANATTVAPLNTWSHLAYVRHGNVYSVYLNGTLIGSQTTSSTPASTSGINIGGRYYNDGGGNVSQLFNGYISNLRVTGNAVYTSNFVPSTAPLTAITGTQVLTCQSNNFIDNSTNALTLTAVGSPQVSNTTPFTNSYPFVGTSTGSIYFNGSSYLNTVSTTVGVLGSTFTIETWVYVLAYPNTTPRIISVTSGGITSLEVGIYTSGTGVYLSGAVTGSNSTAIPLNTWTHIAVVVISGVPKIYINGISQTLTGTVSGYNYTTTGSAYIGAQSTGSYAFNGYITNLRIIGGIATYTSNFTPPTAPLIPIQNTTLLLTGTNAGIIDQSGLNDLVTVGGCRVSTAVTKYGTGSIAFDGSTGYAYAPITNPLYQFSGNFTVESWVYLTGAYSTTPVIFHCVTSGQATTGFSIALTSSGFVQLGIAGSGTSITGSTALTQNAWHHVALCRNNGNLTLYLDGVSQGTATSVTYNFSSGVCVIGSYFGSDFWSGYMDDFRITNGVARYTSNFTPPSQLPTI